MKRYLSIKQSLSNKLGRFMPAGFMVNTPSGTGSGDIEGPVEVMFAGVVGALLGFILGLLIGVMTRVFTVNAAKGTRGGLHWAAYGAGAGAMALAIIELLD